MPREEKSEPAFPVGVVRTLDEVLAAHGPLPLYNPDGSQSELSEMQKEDTIKLAALGRALGDLPVGYGKTAIATCVALMLGLPTTVILVPPILITQWVKWLGSIRGAGRVIGYEGGPRQRAAMPIRTARWLVMSFQIFRNDIARLEKELGDRMTVVDETQNLKSHKSKLFKFVRDFSMNQPLLLMSGTIMSKPGDGYSYVKLNNPDVYETYRRFEAIHVEKFDFFDNPVEWRHLDVLQKNLDLSRVRRTKEEVHANLPKVNYIPIEYELDKAHMALYRKLMDEQLLEIGDGKIDATTAGKLYSASQQIIANWAFFSDDEANVPQLFNLIDTILDEIGLGQPVLPGDPPRSKLIIWTIFKRTSRRVLAYLNEKGKKPGWRAVGAYGEVDSREGVRAFMDDADALVLVAQPGSAGAGLNPQGFTWEMLFAESPTTTIPFTQCCGRIDRTGQVNNPNIRVAVAKGTIQEILLKVNLIKNDALVVAAGGSKQAIKDLIFPK